LGPLDVPINFVVVGIGDHLLHHPINHLLLSVRLHLLTLLALNWSIPDVYQFVLGQRQVIDQLARRTDDEAVGHHQRNQVVLVFEAWL